MSVCQVSLSQSSEICVFVCLCVNEECSRDLCCQESGYGTGTTAGATQPQTPFLLIMLIILMNLMTMMMMMMVSAVLLGSREMMIRLKDSTFLSDAMGCGEEEAAGDASIRATR